MQRTVFQSDDYRGVVQCDGYAAYRQWSIPRDKDGAMWIQFAFWPPLRRERARGLRSYRE